MAKDWNGNKRAVFGTIGASNHCADEREENDYYATSPRAVEMLLERETFDHTIWEPACGENHITKVLRNAGYEVYATDLINRTGDTEEVDFLATDRKFDGDIITNPPYKYGMEFVQKALDVIPEGHKVAMYLKLTFLEGQKRYAALYAKGGLKTVYVAVKRMGCAKNGQFADAENEYEAGAVAFGWFIFEKGYKGEPTIRWFNEK